MPIRRNRPYFPTAWGPQGNAGGSRSSTVVPTSLDNKSDSHGTYNGNSSNRNYKVVLNIRLLLVMVRVLILVIVEKPESLGSGCFLGFLRMGCDLLRSFDGFQRKQADIE